MTKEHQAVSVEITGATNLGSILDTENVYASSMIVAMSAQSGAGQASLVVSVAVAWVRRSKQILQLSEVARFQGIQSVLAVNSTVVEWVKALRLTDLHFNSLDSVDYGFYKDQHAVLPPA